KDFPDNAHLLALWLEYLHKTGHYAEYVTESEKLAKRFPASRAFQVHRLEGLMGTGRLVEVERAAAALCDESLKANDDQHAAEALQYWAISRLRQGKPLGGPGTP